MPTLDTPFERYLEGFLSDAMRYRWHLIASIQRCKIRSDVESLGHLDVCRALLDDLLISEFGYGEIIIAVLCDEESDGEQGEQQFSEGACAAAKALGISGLRLTPYLSEHMAFQMHSFLQEIRRVHGCPTDTIPDPPLVQKGDSSVALNCRDSIEMTS